MRYHRLVTEEDWKKKKYGIKIEDININYFGEECEKERSSEFSNL